MSTAVVAGLVSLKAPAAPAAGVPVALALQPLAKRSARARSLCSRVAVVAPASGS